MQTSPLNRPVYFCWAAGGNMCLTSVSLARRFAAGLHCPLTTTPLKLARDNGWFQRAPVITVQSMSSCLRTTLLTEMVFGTFIVSHFESVWAAVYTSSLKRALDRQQQSKHMHKVQRVPRHNKLSKTIKPCTTCSTSKSTVISNLKLLRYSEYDVLWLFGQAKVNKQHQTAITTTVEELIIKTLDRQTAPAVLLMMHWKKMLSGSQVWIRSSRDVCLS